MMHLLDSDVPLVQGVDMQANCGKLVPQAAVVHTQDWSGGMLSAWLDNLSTLACCGTCIDIARKPKPLQYTYAIADGRKVRGEKKKSKKEGSTCQAS